MKHIGFDRLCYEWVELYKDRKDEVTNVHPPLFYYYQNQAESLRECLKICVISANHTSLPDTFGAFVQILHHPTHEPGSRKYLHFVRKEYGSTHFLRYCCF